MSPDLSVPLSGSRAIQKAHSLQHSIFPILLFNRKKRFLYLTLLLELFLLLLPLLILFLIIGKKIKLFIAFFFPDLFLTDYVIGRHAHPSDQKLRVHDPVIQGKYRLYDQPG